MTGRSSKLSGEAEFQALMEAIDADMRSSQMPIPQRELAAIRLLRKRLGVTQGVMLSDLPEKSQDGVKDTISRSALSIGSKTVTETG
jgi:hypothetical protein